MAKLSIFAIIAFLACLAIINVTAQEADDGQLRYTDLDTDGNPCPPCITTFDYRPVCGTNGKTYVNRSLMNCDSKCKKSIIEVQHEGECA